MGARKLLCLLIGLTITSYASAGTKYHAPAVPASQDTILIPGGTLVGGENAGSLESTINGDATSSGARVNPNRVYALNEGQVYYQLAPINVYNPTGTLAFVGVPSTYGTTKPIVLIQPTNGTDVVTNVAGVNEVYGSLKFDNIHYQSMQLDGYQNNELFYCGTANRLPQSLTINNCLFEFSNIDLFDCTNESGAIGGWPYGAKFFITNSYFRNLFYAGQWWGSRIFQCKHPIDTLWVENCTITTGALTFLQQNELTAFLYVTHNTIVNNKKDWLLSPFYIDYFVTNNIFINQNWVGEDTNVTSSGTGGQTPFSSTINIDSVNDPGLLVVVQQQYYASASSSSYTDGVALKNMKVFVSDNDNYDDPIMNAYYTNENQAFEDTAVAYPLSYLGWYVPGPQRIRNIPGEWMNTRTRALFAKYAPSGGNVAIGCGFVEQNAVTGNPHTVTPGIADSATMVQMAIWNQNQWGDPRYPSSMVNILNSKYIYGDYDPKTIPGIDTNGNKTEKGIGIRKFTDLGENFSQTTYISHIDGLPLGAQIWDDAKNAVYLAASAGYASSSEYHMILNAATLGGVVAVKGTVGQSPQTYTLSQNYPNPFNPTTQISYTAPQNGFVTLKVYNVLGQEVATLFSGQQTNGDHIATFDGSKFASGVYFYRLQASSFTITKKMMLMK